jgi:DNA-binding FadR family transcriptional regulator
MKLHDKIVDQLKEDINNGKYKLGDKIPAEHELMQIYTVGRSTIREAIKTLAISGILKVQQGSGTFVCNDFKGISIEQRLRRADFDDINSVRALLEKEIVTLATLHHTVEQLAEIESQLGHRKAAILAEEQQACADADIAFHMAVAYASGNNVLAELYHSFTLIIKDFLNARDKKGIGYYAMNHYLHEQLFQAIKSKKANLSQQAIKRILDGNY